MTVLSRLLRFTMLVLLGDMFAVGPAVAASAAVASPAAVAAPAAAEASFLAAQQEVFDNPRPTIPAVNEPIPEQ